MPITPSTLVAAIASRHPRSIAVFERHGVDFCCGGRRPLGAALASLRELSSGFAVPGDGCNTYRALYEGLARFERELHEHVHLENNVLFPRVVSLAAHAPSAG
jgi:iron-sulfur cluster repair protein YtfE (RIC family)